MNLRTMIVVVGYALCSSMLEVIKNMKSLSLITKIDDCPTILNECNSFFHKLGMLHDDPFVWETTHKSMPYTYTSICGVIPWPTNITQCLGYIGGKTQIVWQIGHQSSSDSLEMASQILDLKNIPQNIKKEFLDFDVSGQ
jgi:hypothetical protein